MDAKVVANYLTKLKEKTGLTFEAIAEQSGLSESTVKNLFSGKSEDPRLNTVAPVTYVLNGSVDEMYAGKSKEDLSKISITSIKEMYEFQLENTRAHYERHISDNTQQYEKRLTEKDEHNKFLKKENLIFKVFCCVCLAILIGLLILEVSNPSLGWIQY